MAYSTGILRNRVTILNRAAVEDGRFGKDSGGVEFEDAGSVWADVTWRVRRGDGSHRLSKLTT